MSDGYKAEIKVFGNRVTVPEFEIFSNPIIKISSVKARRFNIIDRGPSFEMICNDLKNLNSKRKIKKYILDFIKDYSDYRKLREAIVREIPEFEIFLDKALVLK